MERVSDETLDYMIEEERSFWRNEKPTLKSLVYDELQAYRDTRLTPERCAELAVAEREKRLIELPCKVGDTVYRIVKDANPHITKDELISVSWPVTSPVPMYVLLGNRAAMRCDFGRTLFLTREEAEHALEGRQSEQL